MSGRRGSLEAVETSSLVFVYPRLGDPSNGSLRPSFVRGQTLERVEETAEPRERKREIERDGAKKERGGKGGPLPSPLLTMQPDLWAGRAYVELHTIS